MKFKNITFLALLVSVLFSSFAVAQERNCGSMEYLEYQKDLDPKRAEKLQRIDAFTNRVLANQSRAVEGVITIPTVVHVIYNTAAQNISDAQIASQMQVLNDDFRRLNADADNTWPQADDAEIEFCLATVDPQGNATNGITRTQTSVSGFSTNDNMKFNSSGGHDAWPAGEYLNIWVCNISGGILGYAQFPGGNPATDGVVCDYQYFGTIGTATAPFDLGRTGTHEVGHWLNLRHIWGDGACGVDDFVSDTPTSDAPNYGCTPNHVSCSSVDMVQNYMDYSDDACMNLLTTGQKNRMRALFEPGGARASLLSSGGCGTPGGPTCSDGIQNGDETGVDCGGSCPACPEPCTDNLVTVEIVLDNYPEETTWTITDNGGSIVASGGPYGSQPDGSTVTSEWCLVDGCYNFNIFDSYGDGICCSWGNGSYEVTDNGGNILASGGAFGSSETTNFCLGGGAGPTCDDGIQNGDETGVDCGGSCVPCDTGGDCTYTTIDYNEFVSTWGIWNDGGNDCRISAQDQSFANTAPYCIRLRDDSNTSNFSSDALDVSAYDEVRFSFTYISASMENGEGFIVETSANNGQSYTIAAEFVAGQDFNNNVREFPEVTITSGLSSTFRIRVRTTGNENGDRMYFDDLLVEGCQNGNRLAGPEAAPATEAAPAILETTSNTTITEMTVLPNPVTDFMNVNYTLSKEAVVQIMVYDLTGKPVFTQQLKGQAGAQFTRIDATTMNAGFYIVQLLTEGERMTQKFLVVR